MSERIRPRGSNRFSHPFWLWELLCWAREVDAQKEEVQALSARWPDVPHQTCQFHALREASRPGFEVDGKCLAQMPEQMQSKIRRVRKQIQQQTEKVSEAEAKQLEILDEYALGVQAALTPKGTLPFDDAAVEAWEALDELASSLDGLEKKGGQEGR